MRPILGGISSATAGVLCLLGDWRAATAAFALSAFMWADEAIIRGR